MSNSKSICCNETISHGDLGVVRGEERVARVVTSPNHIRKSDGGLKPGVFPISHLSTKGLSLTRVDKVSRAEFHSIAEEIAGQSRNETIVGALVCRADSVRALKDEDDIQSLCLYDAPIVNRPGLPDNPAHAEALCSRARDKDADIDYFVELQLKLLTVFDLIKQLDQIHKDKTSFSQKNLTDGE